MRKRRVRPTAEEKPARTEEQSSSFLEGYLDGFLAGAELTRSVDPQRQGAVDEYVALVRRAKDAQTLLQRDSKLPSKLLVQLGSIKRMGRCPPPLHPPPLPLFRSFCNCALLLLLLRTLHCSLSSSRAPPLLCPWLWLPPVLCLPASPPL